MFPGLPPKLRWGQELVKPCFLGGTGGESGPQGFGSSGLS